MEDPYLNLSQSAAAGQNIRPTDFLAFSRQYATEMGPAQDIGSWKPQEFQAFLDWWLLRTSEHFICDDRGE